MATKNPHTKKQALKTLKHMGEAPVGPKDLWNKRVLVFTPSRGLVRMEWVHARYGQIIPTNFSLVEMTQFLSPYIPIGYQLADAQNLMAKKVVEDNYDWIIYVEDDNILPPDAFRRFNEYMLDGRFPVVSGLYFTKSNPPEPLVYRGRGNGYFSDFKLGDLVWADGIPFGCRLEHASLLKAAWETAPEYMVAGEKTRRVFESPQLEYLDENAGGYARVGGTTDLEWCRKIIDEDLFAKAGFPDYSKKQYPFLVDTNIFVHHIDQDGIKHPIAIPEKYRPDYGSTPRTIE